MAQGLDGIQMRGINDLALNYSKQQLAHLVQIGQLDPAKAMLAGMAIDRVQTNAQTPPTSTVFDDVLGQQAQQPQDMSGIASMAPQQGQQPQPEQMPQEGAGVSALPSGIEGMADGGIVGYSGGDVVKSEETSSPAGRFFSSIGESVGNIGKTIAAPFLIDPKKATALEEIDRQIKEKNVALFKLSGATGIRQQTEAERLRYEKLKQDLESLTTQRRAIESSGSIMPSIRDRTPVAAPVAAPVVTPTTTALPTVTTPEKDSTTFAPATGGGDPAQQRIFAQERAKIVAAIAAEKNPANKARLQEDLAAIDREIAGLSKQSKTQPYPDATGGRKDSVPNPFAPPSVGGAPASPYDLPALSDPRYKVDVPVEPTPIPRVRSVKEITAGKTEAEKDAGVDTEVYSKMIDSIGKKREDLAGRRGEAIGEAIMVAGLKLMGARKGQEFKALSEGAQEGLKQFAASMKEVKAAQDKYDERMEAYRLAENEAKRTGVTSALATVEKDKDRLQAAEAENRKAKNRAAEVAATLGAGLKEADIRAMSALFGAQARTGFTQEEAMKMAMKSLSDRGKINPTPAEVQAEISKLMAIYSGDAAAAPASVDYANKYGIAPTR